MNNFCRLRVKMPYEAPYPREEIYSLEQAKHLLFSRGQGVVAVEGEIVFSYEELSKVAMEKCKEVVDVVVIPILEGG